MKEQGILKFLKPLTSVGGIIVILTLLAVCWATYTRGPYILVNILITSGMLSMVALGLSLIFGVMNIGMFAHGEFFMIGTLVAYYFITPVKAALLGSGSEFLIMTAPLIGLVLAFGAGAAAGIAVEFLAFRPLRKRNRDNWVMNTFLVTLGISIILVNAHMLFFGTQFKGILNYWSAPPINLFGVYISIDRIVSLSVSVVAVIAFWLFMQYTKLGRSIRAVSQDETGAIMVGIPMEKIMLLTMALACGLASLAGSSLLFMYPSYPMVGMEPLYLSWFVVILVGLGNTIGTLIGAFLMATFKALTTEYVGAGWDHVVPTAFILLILIFKPSGIFGSKVRSVLDQ